MQDQKHPPTSSSQSQPLSSSAPPAGRESRNALLAGGDNIGDPRHRPHQMMMTNNRPTTPLRNRSALASAAAAAAATGTTPMMSASSPHRHHSHHHHHGILETAMDHMIARSPNEISPLELNTMSMRRAANELMGIQRMRSRRSIIDVRPAAAAAATEDNDDGIISEYWLQQQQEEDHPSQQHHHHHHHENNNHNEQTPLLGISSSSATTSAVQNSDFSMGGGTGIELEDGLKYSSSTSSSLKKRNSNQVPFVPILDHQTPAVGTTSDDPNKNNKTHHPTSSSKQQQRSSSSNKSKYQSFEFVLQQASSVAVVSLLNIMIAIPFGTSYFPIGWRDTSGNGDGSNGGGGGGEQADDGDDINGEFPLPGKQALGIRMFLFSTLIGQLAFTFASKFDNPIGLQMVENVPFLHALCHTVIQQQGYGIQALSTVFFLFGLSSVIVGIVFWALGRLQLGKIVYFFPNHVLVGCIGGIGVFIVITAIEVTNDVTFTFDIDGLKEFVSKLNLFSVVLMFEIVLRLLTWATQDKHGRPKYPLLPPIYYCLITPIFYLGLLVFGVSLETAAELGYFFPSTEGSENDDSSSIWTDPHMWDIFTIIDLSTVSWTAVFQSTGTVIALAMFSLIHVPINIPSFAISTDVDTDMNAELIAHGISNGLAGIFGGLQNYMTYSNSVLYAKSGGRGKISSLAIVACTAILFVIGPAIASYLPRCMAGTLLLHIGVDLFLEGVYDSYGNYDVIEYTGIWVIVIVMSVWGMSAALIAGVIAALSTYAVQSINYHNPIRQIMTGSTLRSSAWARCNASRMILESPIHGRARILIFQLQGHLFFGNVAQLSDTIREVLIEKRDEGMAPLVVIIDFTLVLGMDSSAAHAVAKLKKIIHRLFHVELSIFVTGSDRGGFPCEFALSEALTPADAVTLQQAAVDWNDVPASSSGVVQSPKTVKRGSISVAPGSASIRAGTSLNRNIDGTVCESLDDALKFAEDILVARENPRLEPASGCYDLREYTSINMTLEEEKHFAKKFMKDLFPTESDIDNSIEIVFKMMVREEYAKDQMLWAEGDESDSLKLLVCGKLVSIIEDAGANEIVYNGNILGELGLVQGAPRLTTVVCSSEKAVLYSLRRDAWTRLQKQHPDITTLIDRLVIRYLAHRVQHVNNRYFHTTLPV